MAAYDAPVLIEGETGTGKELAARSIHYLSARRDRPFVPVNCGALVDSLIESQLFGHRRGAFTDAKDHQPGLVSLARSGTLFLDEVEALSLKGQVTLLRFLQDQRFRPLGGVQDEQGDVRVIAASNQPLEKLAESERFRIDLLYRLKLMYLRLPALRERREDVAMLARHFVEHGAKRFGCRVRPISSNTLAWFREYAWPGNVRELEHLVYQGMLLSDGDEIIVAPPDGLTARESSSIRPSYRDAKARAMFDFEHDYLRSVIEQAQGNISAAARIAGTERRHLGRLLRKHGIRLSTRLPG